MSGKIEISRELAERIMSAMFQRGFEWSSDDPEPELRAILAAPVVERQPVAVSDEQLQSLADEAFRKWEKIGNPVSGVNGYMAAKAGFREGAAWATCAELRLDKAKELDQ